MSNVLGLAAFVLFILVVIGVAAGLTWLVVRFSPKHKKSEPAQP